MRTIFVVESMRHDLGYTDNVRAFFSREAAEKWLSEISSDEMYKTFGGDLIVKHSNYWTVTDTTVDPSRTKYHAFVYISELPCEGE